MSTRSHHLTLLGKPILARAGGEVASLSVKQLGLVARLYGNDDGPVHRRELSRLLWPRAKPANARHSLSQALYVINRAAPGVVRSDPERIWAEDAVCDVGRFRDAIAASRWVRAGRLYAGPFLDGFAIPGAPSFSHWLDGVRTDLTTLAERAVEGLFEALQWNELLRLTSVLVEQGCVEEDVIRAQLAALTHERGPDAAQRFLERHPDVAASVEALESGPGDGVSTGTSSHPFVGRAGLMGELRQLFERSIEGEPAVALLRGEPGIGKTALADRYCRYLALKGARVLSAVGQVSEQNVPHGIVEQWLGDLSPADLAHLDGNPWMAVIRHVFPGLAGSEESPHPDIGSIGDRRLLESLRRLFVDLARRKPLVLSIDDLHLADPASLGLLRYLFRPRSAGPSLVVATIREATLVDLPQIHGWEAVHDFEIGPLSPDEIQEWVERAGIPAESPAQLSESLHRRTGGNPLLISALLDEGDVTDSSSAPPPSIIEFYRPRIMACSREARRLLAAISIVGEPRSWEDLAEIADLTAAECAESSAELDHLNWIASDANAMSLRHSLLGQTAISLLTTLERRAFHGRTARVLAAGGESTNSIVAVSHDLAGNREAAFAAAIQAAEACETLNALSEKEFFLKIALGNASSALEGAEIRLKLAEVYLDQRRLPMAVDVLDMEAFQNLEGAIEQRANLTRLQALAEMTGDAEVLRDLWQRAHRAARDLPILVIADPYTRISNVAFDLGLDSLAAELVEFTIQRLAELPPTVEHAQRILKPMVLLGLIKGVNQTLRKLQRLPSPSDEHPLYAARFSASKASLLVASGELAPAEDLFAASLGIAERFAFYDALHALHNNLGVCLMEQGRFDEAEVSLHSALHYAADTSPSERSTTKNNLTILAYERRSFEEALQTGLSLLAAGEVHGWKAILDLWAIIGLSAFEMGELAQAREAEREIKALAPRSGKLGNDMSYIYIFLARMMEFRKQVDEAVASLETGIQHYRPRNRLAAVRMELEKCRLRLKSGVDCTDRLDALLADLQGTGAVPLIEKAESLKTRAALKRR